MSLSAIALSSFLVALSGALSPGPLLAVTMSRSIYYGTAKEGILISLGHSILELVMVIMLLLGFGYYLQKPDVASTTGVIGGCVLILFGSWMLFTREIIIAAELIDNCRRRSSPLMSILSGIIVSLSNPYWFLWWITIGLTYLSIALPRGTPGVMAFFLGHISADFLWYGFVSLALAKGIKPVRFFAFHIIIRLCGLFLVGFGIFLIARVIV